MICGTALLTGNDAASKYLTESYPIGQVVCLRQAAALVAMIPYIAWVTGWGRCVFTPGDGSLREDCYSPSRQASWCSD